jgi:hypothetical protein
MPQENIHGKKGYPKWQKRSEGKKVESGTISKGVKYTLWFI